MIGPISEDRISHMVGVANYMYDKAPKYDLNPEYMYVLGLMHDIGYIDEGENHAQYGSQLLYDIGLRDTDNFSFNTIIANHSIIPDFEMDWNNEEHKIKYLLYEADMSVNSTGRFVNYDNRLEDIYTRYGDSDRVDICREVVAWLEKYEKK